MANYFEQFDDELDEPAVKENYFAQFDEPVVTPAVETEEPAAAPEIAEDIPLPTQKRSVSEFAVAPEQKPEEVAGVTLEQEQFPSITPMTEEGLVESAKARQDPLWRRKGLIEDYPGLTTQRAPGKIMEPLGERNKLAQIIDKIIGPPGEKSPEEAAKATIEFQANQEGITGSEYRQKYGARIGLLERGLKDIQSGAVSTASGMLGFAARLADDGTSAGLRAAQGNVNQYAADVMAANPGFADELLAGFGSTATFFVPGVGLVKGAEAVAKVAPRMALWLGSGGAAGMEAAVESGMVYDEVLEKTGNKEDAEKAADQTFWGNVPLLVITNKLGLFGDKGGQVQRRTMSAIMEGPLQEAPQQMISNLATDTPIMEGTGKAALIGGIVGATLGGTLPGRQVKGGDVAPTDIIPSEPEVDQTGSPSELFKPTHKAGGGKDVQYVTKNGKIVPDTYMDQEGNVFRDSNAVPVSEEPADLSMDVNAAAGAIKAEVFGKKAPVPAEIIQPELETALTDVPRGEIPQVTPEVLPTAEPLPAAEEVVTEVPEAAEVERKPFITQAEIAKTEYQEKAKKLGLTEEQIKELEPQEVLDVVTGLQKAEQREPTMKRAIEHVSETGEQGHYIEADITNLGGLNDKLGHTGANKVYNKFATIFAEEMDNIGVDATKFRHGGDEISAIVVNASKEQIDAALAKTETRIAEYTKAEGLSEIIHPKHRRNKEMRGTGLIFGTSEITGNKEAGDIFSEADISVEQTKRERADVDRKQIKEAGVTGVEGQARRADEGARAEEIGITEQIEEPVAAKKPARLEPVSKKKAEPVAEAVEPVEAKKPEPAKEVEPSSIEKLISKFYSPKEIADFRQEASKLSESEALEFYEKKYDEGKRQAEKPEKPKKLKPVSKKEPEIKAKVEPEAEVKPAEPEAKPTPEPAAPKDKYRAMIGKEISYEVEVADTGETYTVTVDAGAIMKELDAREEALKNLRDCI